MWKIFICFLIFAVHFVLSESKGEDNEKSRELFLNTQFPFDLSNVQGVSRKCQEHSHVFVDAFRKFDMWALQMYDASAKLSSGILTGNVHQYGNFDECLGLSTGEEFAGKYCLSYLQVKAWKKTKFVEKLINLTHVFEPYASNLNDSGHVIPKIYTINWGLCVPSTCSNDDVAVGLRKYTRDYSGAFGVEFDVSVEERMCQIREPFQFSGPLKMTLLFFGLILLITVLSTIYEFIYSSKNELLTAFSLINNTNQMISTKRESSDIKIAHGIRFLNIILLIVAHKSILIFYEPYANRNDLLNLATTPWSVFLRSAVLYTDSFLMMSGMLTAYSFFGRYSKGLKVQLFNEYAGRYLRIFPSIGALMLFYMYIMPLTGSGPQWPAVISRNSEICKETWWRNLFFIQNFFGFANICVTNTHYVAVDTQLFVMAPFVTWIIWKHPYRGTIAVVGLAVLSTVLRFYSTYVMELDTYVSFGTSIKQLFDTADYMYILSTHRFTSYSIGILLGYFLRMHKNAKLSKSLEQLGWILCPLLFFASFLGPMFRCRRETVYNPLHSALYASLGSIGWCVSIAWIIFMVERGAKNILVSFLEWKGFLIVTRISYAIYLTQFPVFYYNIGSTRGQENFNAWTALSSFYEYLWIIIVSILLTLFIEMPFSNLKKVLINGKPKKE